ncbi:amidohydrolase family protein [Nonomuraea sp. NPDC050404]|uniref:amidohydrolase family protein n=1 Tax=Nonomuraea sp. NPDC050404 TaxID=3155783 RepID=UPI00340C543B
MLVPQARRQFRRTLGAAAGLTPREALTAATSAPADRFGLTDRGRIAPGLRADLLLVNGDPTTNIDATLDIAGVWLGGVRLAGR